MACGRSVRRGLALAVHGNLVEVCELCYLLGSINGILVGLQAPEAIDQALDELRQLYQLLRAIEVSRS